MIVHTGPHYIKQKLFGFEAFYLSAQCIGTFPTYKAAQAALIELETKNRGTQNGKQ